VVANTLNIAADLVAIGSGMALLSYVAVLFFAAVRWK
jgi:hypothetical protein